jgi:hypothetical protein
VRQRRVIRLFLAATLTATSLMALSSARGASGPVSAWVPTLPLSQQSREELSAFPDGTAYVFDVGSSTGITLWHSANHGLSWDPLTYLPAISTFAEARFATPKVGYLIDFDRMFTTTNGATTATGWRQLSGPRVPKGDSIGMDTLGVTGSTVSVGGGTTGPLHIGCNPPKSADIWTSHDSGRTWSDARFPANVAIGSIRYVSARDGVAWGWEMHQDGKPCEYLGDTNSVYVTHDGGRHFRLAMHCAVKGGELCTSATFLDPRHLLVGRNNGTMTASSDGGRTFHEQQSLATVLGPQPTGTDNDEIFWIQGFAFAGQTIFATTKLAGAYVSGDGGRTWVRESTCDTAYSLGIGDIAAFDGHRAIAGGPTCISTRTDGPAAPATALPSRRAGSGVDVVSQGRGLRAEVSGGQLLVNRSSATTP